MNKYIYNDKVERVHRMNRFGWIASILLFIVMGAYIGMLIGNKEATMASLGWDIIVLAVMALFNAFVLWKNKTANYFKNIIAIEVGIQFAILALLTPASFLGLALLGVLMLLIPYYEGKSYRVILICYAVLYIVCQVVRGSMGMAQQNANSICQVIMTLALFIVAERVAALSGKFSEHALGAIEEQNEKQEKMMEEIIEISQTIKIQSDASTERMNQLLDSAVQTADSMKGIADSAENTAANIEVQNEMTQNIQAAIEETKVHSERMVSIATDSNEGIKKNQQVIEDLKGNSVHISETNAQVNEAMEKLQNKTKEVEEIVNMIISISNQTNLLALNASIESARAGEAGRGFAVVAEQIRQLSEETRKSTESITTIISELNENAQTVTQAISSSVEVADNQNSMIMTAADTFGQLNQNMTEMISGINVIDQRIEYLSEANNSIVENITKISAITEEVTQSAEQTSEFTKMNVQYVQDTKQAIGMIQEKAEGLEQYI